MDREFQIRNGLDELITLRHSINRLAQDWGISRRTAFELRVIVEELCVNYIEHSGDSSSNTVTIKLFKDESEIVITVTDSGPPFDPTTISSPDLAAPLEKRQRGGLGLHFVRHFSDEMLYAREHDTNIVTIIKKRNSKQRGKHGNHCTAPR